MSDLTLTPTSSMTVSESITAITIPEIRIHPSKDTIMITARAGNRSVVVDVNNKNADSEASPPVVGNYAAVIAEANLAAIIALLQPAVEAAFTS